MSNYTKTTAVNSPSHIRLRAFRFTQFAQIKIIKIIK